MGEELPFWDAYAAEMARLGIKDEFPNPPKAAAPELAVPTSLTLGEDRAHFREVVLQIQRTMKDIPEVTQMLSPIAVANDTPYLELCAYLSAGLTPEEMAERYSSTFVLHESTKKILPRTFDAVAETMPFNLEARLRFLKVESPSTYFNLQYLSEYHSWNVNECLEAIHSSGLASPLSARLTFVALYYARLFIASSAHDVYKSFIGHFSAAEMLYEFIDRIANESPAPVFPTEIASDFQVIGKLLRKRISHRTLGEMVQHYSQPGRFDVYRAMGINTKTAIRIEKQIAERLVESKYMP